LSLWLAQIFSQLADRVIFVVFVAVIANNFGSSTSIQSWLYVSFTIPAICLTAIAGVFIDRCNKKVLLLTTNILRALTISLLPFLDNHLHGIYVLAFLISSVTQFFVPAEASMMPTVVNKYQLMVANSLFTTTMMASIIFGFALGDPLINIFGLKSVYISIASMFIISCIFLTFIDYKPTNKENDPHKTLKEFIDELKQGFIYTKNNPIVYNAIFKLAILFSVIVMLSILTIGLSQQYLYPHNPALGAQKFAYIITSSGIGMVFGSFLVAKIFRNTHKYRLIFGSFFSIGICMLLLSVINFVPESKYYTFRGFDIWFVHLETFNLTLRMIYSYFVSGILGLSSAFVAIPVQTILQSSVQEDMRGKVFGLQFTLLSTASTMPVIIAAVTADFIGVLKMLGIIGICLVIFGSYNLLKLYRSK
jgi:MFS family permease